MLNAIQWAITQSPNGYATVYNADKSIYRSYSLSQVDLPDHLATEKQNYTNDSRMLSHSPLEHKPDYRENLMMGGGRSRKLSSQVWVWIIILIILLAAGVGAYFLTK